MIYKKVIFYITAVSLGALSGWQLRDILISTPNLHIAPNTEPFAEQKLDAPENKTLNSEINPDPATSDQQPDEQAMSVSTFLERLSLLSGNEFNQLFNGKEINRLFSKSPELFDSLLEQLLDMSDPKLADRVSQVLSWHSINSPKLQEKTENLIFEKIKTYERSPEWLAVLSKWGVHQPDNLVYLSDQLTTYSDPLQTTNALNAIASSFAPFNNKLNADEAIRLNNSIEPFLSASDEAIRASAVQSLRFLTYPDRDDRVLSALKDSSSKVRISAMGVVANQHIKPEEVKSLIIDTITDKSREPMERLAAYQINSIFALSQSEYELVYEFVTNEAEALQEQYLKQQRALRIAQE